MKKYIYILAAFVALVSCSVKDARQEKASVQSFPPSGRVVLTASCGGEDPATRTIRESDGRVFWSARDKIKVFAVKADGVEFTSTNTSPAASAQFLGEIPVDFYNEQNEHGGKGGSDFAMFPVLLAVYPANCDFTHVNEVNYESYEYKPGQGQVGVGDPISYEIMHSLPGDQTAVEGTFDNNLFVSATASSTTDLHFHHVTGGFKFSVAGSDIYKVELTTASSDAYLTGDGRIKIAADGSLIGVETYDYNYAFVQTESGNFIPGKYYYIVTWPAVATGGFTLRFYTESGTKERVITQDLEFRSGRFLVLNNADSNLDDTGGVSGGLEEITYDPIN
jgi:hypothetical protein